MRKTKIICTLGPATDAPGVLKNTMRCGMNVARFNFSHGTHADHKKRLDELKQLREELGLPVATLLDTKGPEIRLKHFEHGKVILEHGQTFTLTTRAVMGNQQICGITYKDLPQDVIIGSQIMLDDGLISMRVTELTETDIICRVENGGLIKDRKGVNVPGIHLSMPYMSQNDREDILFGIEQGFDFVAASFCRNEQDVLDIRRFIEEHNGTMHIIAKIENQEGVDNIAAIMAVVDGVMIARGDMGVEIDFTEIPVIQKEIISRAMANGKTVITATQMLDSMINNPRPTRAEITDVANAVYDGTSAVMLSGETAAGQFPVEAVRTMAAIANRTEADINYFGRMLKMTTDAHLGISDATAHAACTTATDTNASAIISVSKSGATARRISKYRPETPIVACVMDLQIQRQLALTWGVTPILMPFAENTDDMIDFSVEAAKEVGLVEDGDIVVVTAGIPAGVSGTTNIMKVHLVGSCLITGVGVGKEMAKGHLCICRNLTEIASKFKQGDVLVIPQTSNEMLPYILKAAAVITEEAGLSSHAAVVGLSTNKAVIIGAVGATKILHDGLYVSVDCKRGIVQNLAQ
jgi:pyruvate kinase